VTTTCPAWCRLPPDHGYIDDVLRFHEGTPRTIDCTGEPDPDPDRQQRRRLIVGVISAERVKLGVEGVQVETTEPVVSVWVEDGIAISLTADQARTLAGVLVESAQALT
jgi:uncharacterized protein DUF6907